MAGNTLYLGNLFSALNGKIDQQITKVDEQITKLDSMIIELQNVKSAVAQQVSSINLKPETSTLYQALTHSGGNSTLYNNAWNVAVRLKASASGVAKITGRIKTSNGGYAASIGYSYDNGATVVSLGSTTSTTFTEIGGNAIIIPDKELSICLSINAGSTFNASIEANSIKVYASKNDITNNGAFTGV